jgi:hypothetical protein
MVGVQLQTQFLLLVAGEHHLYQPLLQIVSLPCVHQEQPVQVFWAPHQRLLLFLMLEMQTLMWSLALEDGVLQPQQQQDSLRPWQAAALEVLQVGVVLRKMPLQQVLVMASLQMRPLLPPMIGGQLLLLLLRHLLGGVLPLLLLVLAGMLLLLLLLLASLLLKGGVEQQQILLQLLRAGVLLLLLCVRALVDGVVHLQQQQPVGKVGEQHQNQEQLQGLAGDLQPQGLLTTPGPAGQLLAGLPSLPLLVQVGQVCYSK